MTAALEAREVTFRVGSSVLVDRLSLTVAAGEVVSLVGPNGAGKSTLVRLLAGDLAAAEGIVLVGGSDISGLGEDELALARAVLLQESDPGIPFVAEAVVALGRYPHRRNQGNSRANDARAIESALSRTDTAHIRSRVFATLSSGERTRVSLARILAQETNLFLLDEPTATLDVHHQEKVLFELRVEAGRGAAVVVVLHDLNAAAAYADRVVVLSDGSAVAAGTPRDVLTENLLSDVYRQQMKVVDHPFRDCPLVLVTG